MPTYNLATNGPGTKITRSVYGSSNSNKSSIASPRNLSMGSNGRSHLSSLSAYGSAAQRGHTYRKTLFLVNPHTFSLSRKSDARKLNGLIWPRQFGGDRVTTGILIPRRPIEIPSIYENPILLENGSILMTEDGNALSTET